MSSPSSGRSAPAPFAAFEWKIAWRYLRARRSEGGVSVMTWISLIGIALAVFALVATLAIRTGLREETLRTILGATAHVELRYHPVETAEGGVEAVIRDPATLSHRLREVPGVTSAVPVVRGRIIGNLGSNNAPLELYGIAPEDLRGFPSIAAPETAFGNLADMEQGIVLGMGLARALGAQVGDRIKLISPNGTRTPFGIKPRVSAFDVVYIFRSGQGLIDQTRAYLPLTEAQPFLNRDGAVDQIDIMLADPEAVERILPELLATGAERAWLQSWRDLSGGYLRALEMQDNALYILLAILVLIASMNIVSGLIMLVKNKGRDIGILRTIGLDQGAVLRVFFLVGALIGTVGTLLGVVFGVIFALNLDHIYAALDTLTGRGKTELELQGFLFPPAVLRPSDVIGAMALSLGLSFLITYFPARRAARMNPVEALRYE